MPESKAVRCRTVIYWIGWIMAAIAYLVIVADLVTMMVRDDYDSLIVLLFTRGEPMGFLLLAWCSAAIICLTAKE